MTNEELINKTDSMLNRHMANDHRLFGDVASAVLSETGNVYVGVCADTPTWGICAERSAIAAMITASGSLARTSGKVVLSQLVIGYTVRYRVAEKGEYGSRKQ